MSFRCPLSSAPARAVVGWLLPPFRSPPVDSLGSSCVSSPLLSCPLSCRAYRVGARAHADVCEQLLAEARTGLQAWRATMRQQLDQALARRTVFRLVRYDVYFVVYAVLFVIVVMLLYCCTSECEEGVLYDVVYFFCCTSGFEEGVVL